VCRKPEGQLGRRERLIKPAPPPGGEKPVVLLGRVRTGHIDNGFLPLDPQPSAGPADVDGFDRLLRPTADRPPVAHNG